MITNAGHSDKYSEIMEISKRLNKQIDEMGQKVAGVIDKN